MTLVRPILTPDRLEKRQNGRRIKDAGEPAHTLTSQDRHGVVIQVNQNKESGGKQPYQQNRVYDSNGISPCLDSNAGRWNAKIDTKIRRLTEIECERLQGLPDNWTKWGMYEVKGELIKKEVSSTQRYKMLGNAVTATVVQRIAERLCIK